MPKAPLLVLFLFCSAIAQTRDDRWRQDLQFLDQQITTKHPNPFTKVTREEYTAAIRALNDSIPERTDVRVVAEMQRIIASIGDAHTAINLTPVLGRVLPIRLRWFTEGLFVTQAAEDYSRGIGKKVLRIGTKSAEEAYLAVRAYISYENDSWARLNSGEYLVRPDILAAAGVIAESGPVAFSIDDGKGGTLEYTLPIGNFALLPGPQLSRPRNPFYLRNAQQYYWFDYLPENRTIYIKYNRCRVSPALPMEDFTRDLVEFASSNPIDRVVLDLRNNSGGNSSILDTLLTGLAEAAIAGKFFPKSGFFGIIGRETFSSGTLNAVEIKRNQAVLVGEATGGGASVFGEVAPFALPNSGISGQVSTRKFVIDGFPGSTVEPDVRVDLTSADFFAERDPVLEKVLELSFVPVGPGTLGRRR